MGRTLFDSHVDVGSQGGDREGASVGDVSSVGGVNWGLFGPRFGRRAVNPIVICGGDKEHCTMVSMCVCLCV